MVVGVGDLGVSNDQSMSLTTYSLGSCIGVAIYDPVARVGGMLHAMLPDGSINEAKAAMQPAMFVNTGLPFLLRALEQLRAQRARMRVALAGAAQILDDGGFFGIGTKNYQRCEEMLRQERLPIHAKDVGGTVSRTIHLNVGNGEVRLKASNMAQEQILFPA
jgi:chemotaxis protein CheD